MSISQATKDRAFYIRQKYGLFIGGSYCVLKETANDIDLIISLSNFNKLDNGDLFDEMDFYGLWEDSCEKLCEKLHYERVHELYASLRAVDDPQINLLVVRDAFYTSYKQAAVTMAADPESYQYRWQRVLLHQTIKNEVRRRLGMDLYDTSNITEATHGV